MTSNLLPSSDVITSGPAQVISVNSASPISYQFCISFSKSASIIPCHTPALSVLNHPAWRAYPQGSRSDTIINGTRYHHRVFDWSAVRKLSPTLGMQNRLSRIVMKRFPKNTRWGQQRLPGMPAYNRYFFFLSSTAHWIHSGSRPGVRARLVQHPQPQHHTSVIL